MKINVIGAGHIGIVNAYALSKLGHEVCMTDVDSKKQNQYRNRVPFFEEKDLDWDYVFDNIILMDEVNVDVDIHLVCIGLEFADDNYETSNLIKLLQQLMAAKSVIVIRSTLGIGEIDFIRSKITNFSGILWPEFLREGSALSDYTTDQNFYSIIGDEDKKGVMDRLNLSGPLINITNVYSLSAVKMYSNAWRAIKLSFINSVAFSDDAKRIDFDEFLRVFKILRGNCDDAYLSPGDPYGGYCLPKETEAASHKLKQVSNIQGNVFLAANKFNDELIEQLHKKIVRSDIKCLLYIDTAFKQGTSDTRNSPYERLLTLCRSSNIRTIKYCDSMEIKIDALTGFFLRQFDKLPIENHANLQIFKFTDL